jgi:hypothetical protein
MKCSQCKRQIKTVAFATFRTRKGEIRRRGICGECRGKYALENFERLKKWRQDYNFGNRNAHAIRSAKKRQEIKDIVDEIKSKARCADCMGIYPSVAMDFDHVRGKNEGIASMVSSAYNLELILEEIKLCEIVCANCHRVRTAKRKQNHASRATQNIGGKKDEQNPRRK